MRDWSSARIASVLSRRLLNLRFLSQSDWRFIASLYLINVFVSFWRSVYFDFRYILYENSGICVTEWRVSNNNQVNFIYVLSLFIRMYDRYVLPMQISFVEQDCRLCILYVFDIFCIFNWLWLNLASLRMAWRWKGQVSVRHFQALRRSRDLNHEKWSSRSS